jgi:basic amino acid/polyamine antiporter, APA family
MVSVALVAIAGKDGVDKLLTGVVCLDCVFFVLTGAALFVLRRRLPAGPRPFRVPLYPVLPALFVLAELAALYGAFQDPATVAASVIALFVLASGVLAYVFFARRSARPLGGQEDQ